MINSEQNFKIDQKKKKKKKSKKRKRKLFFFILTIQLKKGFSWKMFLCLTHKNKWLEVDFLFWNVLERQT